MVSCIYVYVNRRNRVLSTRSLCECSIEHVWCVVSYVRLKLSYVHFDRPCVRRYM